jgi:hypothetical protein
MYEELIKRLREIHPEEFSNQWDFAFACQQVMTEAADAIEELSDISRTTATIIENEKDMRVVAGKPHWISVKERLPDFEGTLLCYMKSSIHKGTYYAGIAYFEDECFYDTDGIGMLKDRITHWMPLPPSPKEEEE